MAPTRRPPVDVFHDPAASHPTLRGHDVEAVLWNALAPPGNTSNKQNLQLHPSTTAANPTDSPRKRDSSPLLPVTAHSLDDIAIPPPSQPDVATDSLLRRCTLPKAIRDHLRAQSRPSKSSAATIHMFGHFDVRSFGRDDNLHAVAPQPHPDVNGLSKGIKRPMSEAKDRSSKRTRTEGEEPIELPNPQDMPPVHDDGTKPPQSYAELIGMAILRAPERRLTLAQIYKWISDHFSFYQQSQSGWQNSIRHNLSLNKNFIKQERPKDDPGKGNYWAIKPGEERPYVLGKRNPVRRITNPDGSQYMQGLAPVMDYRTGNAPAVGNFILAPNPSRRIERKAIDSAKFPDPTDLSSDGTIPASDPVTREEDQTDAAAMPPPGHLRSSPPPADLGSSPPAISGPPLRKATAPPVPRFPLASRSGTRRQKAAPVQDSGYLSSIESSAARGAAARLTSEADMARPRIKRGRAEEEIARIRSSSVSSPTKDRPPQVQASPARLASSSPVPDELSPLRQYPNISPNTNLRLHRNSMKALLGTPAKVFSPEPENNHNWSPAFNVADEGDAGFLPSTSPLKPHISAPKITIGTPIRPGEPDFFHANFDVFIDAPEEDIIMRGSPEKRAVQRPSLARAATSTNILADITGGVKDNINNDNPTLAQALAYSSPFSLSPYVKRSLLGSPPKQSHRASPLVKRSLLGSPLKQSHRVSQLPGPSTPRRGLGNENFRPHDLTAARSSVGVFARNNLPSDGSEEAIDLFQDFGKIGQPATHAEQTAASSMHGGTGPSGVTKSGFGRSNTSRW